MNSYVKEESQFHRGTLTVKILNKIPHPEFECMKYVINMYVDQGEFIYEWELVLYYKKLITMGVFYHY